MELDDGILDHPKFIRAVKIAGSDAVFLWLGLRAHCAKLLTDGLVAEDMIDEVRGPRDTRKRSAALQALKDVRLVEDDPEGVRMHNYLKWSKSRAQVLAQREAARARQTKFRGGNDSSNGGGNAPPNSVTGSVTSRTVPRSSGEERSGDSSGDSDLGSNPSNNGSAAGAREAELMANSLLWCSDPQLATLKAPNPEKWPETRLLVSTLTDVFGGPEQQPRHAADPRMQAILERWAEGRSTVELQRAIRGAGKDQHYRANPQFQTLQTILKDSAQVDKFIRLLTVEPKVAAKTSGRGPVQNNHGKTGTENATRR